MRKKTTAVILAVFVFSLIAASAASLNGISTADLGADSTVVASCDQDGVDVDYTTSYLADADPTLAGLFDVTAVDVTAIDPGCDGYAIEVTLYDGTSTFTSAGAVAGTSASVDFSAHGDIDAELVEEIAIVIAG